MNFEVGDIVAIIHHVDPDVVGRWAKVRKVHPNGGTLNPLLTALDLGFTWYTLLDDHGEFHGASHPWLRRIDPVTFEIAEEEETCACPH